MFYVISCFTLSQPWYFKVRLYKGDFTTAFASNNGYVASWYFHIHVENYQRNYVKGSKNKRLGASTITSKSSNSYPWLLMKENDDLFNSLRPSELNIIVSDNGWSPGRRQAIIWTNTWILFIWPLGTNFSEMLIEIHTFHSRKCMWKCRLRKGGHFVLASMC